MDRILADMSDADRKNVVAVEGYYQLIIANRYGIVEGKYAESFVAFNKSIELGKKISSSEIIGFRWYWAYSNMASSYLELGEVEKAHDAMRAYVEARDQDPHGVKHAYPTTNLGQILIAKGDLQQGRRYLQEALEVVLKSEEPEAIGDMYLDLFYLALIEDKLEEANQMLEQIAELSEQNSNNVRLEDQKNLTKAIILKRSTNVRDRIKAQDLLEELVEKLDYYHANVLIGMNHLCETYLDEVKLFGHKDALVKAEALITRITTIVKDNNSLKFLVDGFLLKARLKLINGDFRSAEAIFGQAEIICGEKGLVALGKRVKAEKSGFEQDLRQMQLLLEQNAPLQERIKQAHIEEYFKTALKIVKD